MPPLRVAMFVGTFPVTSETFILRQISGLLDQGHHVDIYAENRGDLTDALQPEVNQYQLLERTTFLDLPAACSPWELPAWPEDGETWVPGSPTAIANRQRLEEAKAVEARCRTRAAALTSQVLDETNYRYRARSLSALHRLDRLSARQLPANYDVIHAHFGPVGESIRFTRQLWSAPLIVSFHGYDFTTVPRKEGADCYRQLFATADCLTVNSDYTRRRLEALGAPVEKLRKLPMGLHPAHLPFRERHLPSDGPIRCLTVARLVEIKGHEFVLQALANIRATHPDCQWHYDIVGDGPLRGRLTGRIRDLGLTEVVTLHGNLAGPRLQELIAAAHLGLLCSVNVSGDEEGQGLALLEAQASGLPVIATRHGAFPEGVLDGRSGWLVPEKNVLALAEALLQAVLQGEAWPQMGRTGREFVAAHFDQRHLTDCLIGLYRETKATFHPPTGPEV
jgi:colanic acid/amylovoran biosynthesis glycosyltransferase